MFNKLSSTLALFSIVFILGCAGDQAEGVIELELWGEEIIEDGIPENKFADGFSVVFDSFIVNLGEISVASGEEEPVIEQDEMTVWDLTETGPFTITSADAPAGEYDHTAYTIAGATEDSVAGNIQQDDLDLMIDNGYSVYVKGEATDGSVTKRFAWGFTAETRYDPCHSLAEVSDGDEATVQITIHGDHLFYDDAIGAEPALRFNDIALADADQNDEITAEELSEYSISVLPNYLVGSLDIDNLWDYISHMTSTLGHIDGEGHCE